MTSRTVNKYFYNQSSFNKQYQDNDEMDIMSHAVGRGALLTIRE